MQGTKFVSDEMRTVLIQAKTASHAQLLAQQQNTFTVIQLSGSLRQRQKKEEGKKSNAGKREERKNEKKEWGNKERNTRQNPVASTEHGCCGKAPSFVTIPVDLTE